MKRGEIWWAALPDPVGSEPGYRRPVLIVQSDEFTRSGIRTVICAAVIAGLAWTSYIRYVNRALSASAA